MDIRALRLEEICDPLKSIRYVLVAKLRAHLASFSAEPSSTIQR